MRKSPRRLRDEGSGQLARRSQEPTERTLKPQHNWSDYPPRERQVYGSAHNKMRRRVLAEEPECRLCGDPSAVADHIRARCLGGGNERENYQALCTPCSMRKTAQEANLARWHVHRVPWRKESL